MDFKDYYQALGVPPDADEKTIKQTFRKLARQYHPDVNPGNKQAEQKFKELSEAYTVLSDPEQRKKYDQMREDYQRYQQTGGRAPEYNWDAWTAQSNAGPRVQYATAEDLNDLFGDESPFSDFFNQTFRGARNGGQPRPRSGSDIEFPIDITLEEAYHGSAHVLQIGDRRIEAKIPPGVRTGSRVRLAGQGEPGRNGGPAGNLYLIVNVLPHSKFEREGDDLYTDVPIDIYTAALGGEVQVQTMDRPVMLKIPPQTQSGHTFRLRGKGMPKLDDSKSRGDLFARVKLVLPEPLSERELNAFRELKAARANR